MKNSNAEFSCPIKRMVNWDKARTQVTLTYNPARFDWLIEEVRELKAAAKNLHRDWEPYPGTESQSVGLHPKFQAAAAAHVAKESFDVVKIAIGGLYELGFTYADIIHIFNLCCDSNDSRPNRRLEPGEKGVKGGSFKPAEPGIINYILEKSE